jgi:hypothetical protein
MKEVFHSMRSWFQREIFENDASVAFVPLVVMVTVVVAAAGWFIYRY